VGATALSEQPKAKAVARMRGIRLVDIRHLSVEED